MPLPLILGAAAVAAAGFGAKKGYDGYQDKTEANEIIEKAAESKIDKITVWDSGNGDSSGAATANFLSGLIKSLPPLHDIAEMAGLELPKYLGEMKVESDSEKEDPEAAETPKESERK